MRFLVLFFAATTQFCLWCDLLGARVAAGSSPKFFVVMATVQAALLGATAVVVAFDSANQRN